MVHCLSRHGLLLALSVALLAPAARAQAPQKERIALHPCVITGGKKKDISELEALCATAAVRETMELVPSTDVRAFLDKSERGSCAKAKNRNACLGRLAAATKASRSLYITLNPFTPRTTRITGLVVDETGKKIEERPLELPRIPNQAPRDVVRFSVSQLLEQLEVAKAPPPDILVPLTPGAAPEPEPLVEAPAAPMPAPAAPPSPAPTPAVTTERQEAPRGRTWKTPAGIAGVAAGAVGLGVSGFLVLNSNSKAREFNEAFKGGALPPSSERERLRGLRQDVDSQRRSAAIAGSAGAALLIGGAILWFIDRPSSPEATPPQEKAGSARLLAGPGQVGVRVLLP
ncbi:MAG: hypothetical protein JXB05_22825 [Myxococcaceae bacterium]|nr:hypothetical protein [Myxococcaceae bacterium]